MGRPAKVQKEYARKSRRTIRGHERSEIKVAKSAGAVPRKAAIVYILPVPETDTGGRGEDPKADGRSIVKELGKMTP